MFPSGNPPKPITDQPTTPEMASSVNGSTGPARKPVVPPTAPKGKPRAPPLIHGRVKMSDAGAESLSTEGLIPILKTKLPDTEQSNEDKRRRSASTSARSGRSEPPKPSDAHRTVEKVRIARGIEMQRIVQDSHGVKTRHHTAGGSSSPGKQSSQATSNPAPSLKRRMVKTETSVQEVKSFNGHLRPTHSGSNLQSKTKSKSSRSPEAKKIPAQNKLETDPQNPPDTVVNDSNPNTEYKSIDEFLKMSAPGLPEKTPRKLPKEPKSSAPSVSKSSSKETKKSYDLDEVKNFMLKQKETRRIQQMKEMKEREAEAAKRQRMLKDLNSRCQRMVGIKAKSHEETMEREDDNSSISSEPIPQQSPSMKYLKPLLERRKSCILRKSSSASSDVARQSQYLLAEFENIVKRECISFLTKIPVPSVCETQTNAGEKTKVDKCVATSTSLLDITSDSSSKDVQTKPKDISVNSPRSESKEQCRVPSPRIVEAAASRIQAAYKGYKVRQALRDAGIKFGCKPKRQSCLKTYLIPKMPEKPYDNLSRTAPMSPVPIRRKSMSSLMSSYIPPPLSSKSPSPNPPRARVLPAFPITPVRSFNEPYPIPKPGDDVATIYDPKALPMRNSNESRPQTSSQAQGRPITPTYEVGEAACFLDFAVPSAMPSILDVLREKIRQNEGKSDAAKNSTLEGAKQQCTTLSEEGDTLSKSITEPGQTPKQRKHHHRKPRSRSHRPVSADSSTNVDSEFDYASSKSSTSMSEKRHKSSAHENSSRSKSEEVVPSSQVEDLTTTSTEDYLAPAIQLRYEAEREHLKIIEKALQVKLQPKLLPTKSTGSVQECSKTRETEGQSSKQTSETDRVQLAIANCQKESMKAAAEMAKWLAEFQKTTREHDRTLAQETPINLAATVIAAVEQARAMGIEKRREKRLHARQHGELPPTGSPRKTSTSSTESSLSHTRSEKSIKAGLKVLKDFEQDIIRNDSDTQLNRQDYQQQFPSGSERNSPAPVFKIPDSVRLTRGSSVDEGLSKSAEILEYCSIIPSGNTIEIASLDGKVSTLDSFSQVSGFEQEDKNGFASTLDELNANTQPEYSTDRPDSHIVDEHLSHSVTKGSPDSKPMSVRSSFADQDTDINSDSIVEQLATSERSLEQSKIEDSVNSQGVSMGSVEEVINHKDLSQLEDIFVREESSKQEVSDVDTDIADTKDEQSIAVQTDAQLSDNFEPDESYSADEVEDKATETEIPEDIDTDKEQSLEDTGEILEEQSHSKRGESQDIQTVPSDVEDEVENSQKINVGLQPIPPLELLTDAAINSAEDVEDKASAHLTEQLSREGETILTDSCPSLHEIGTEKQQVDQDGSTFSKPASHFVDEEDLEKSSELRESTIEEQLEESQQVPNNVGSENNENSCIVEEPEIDEHSTNVIVDTENNVSGRENNHKSISVQIEEFIEDEAIKSVDQATSVQDITQETDPQQVSIDEEIKSQTEPDNVHSQTGDDKTPTEPDTNLHSHSVGTDDPQQVSSPIEPEIISKTQEPQIHVSSVEVTEPADEDEVITETSVSVNVSSGTEKSPVLSPTLSPQVPKDNEVVTESIQNDSNITSEIPTDPIVSIPEEELVVPEPIKDTSPIKPEPEIYFKPPPPYSPPSSLDSISLSTKSLIISLPEDKLLNIAEEQGTVIWRSYEENSENFPPIESIMEELISKEVIKPPASDANGNLQTSAEQNFDLLLCHLIYETMKQVLQIKSELSTFIEQVRPGPLALEAQKLKIPRSKEALVSLVVKRANAVIPSSFFSGPQPFEIEKPRSRKWCSRPREIVDEILLEELVEEDYQWTEWWPEQVIVSNHISSKIVQTMIRNALHKRKYVLS